MADIAGTYTKNSRPHWKYVISYRQVDRDGSSVTYEVDVAIGIYGTGSYFGYPVGGTFYINNVSHELNWGNTQNWPSGSTNNQRIRIRTNVGGGGGTLDASLNVYGKMGASSPNNTIRGTVSLSTWNTPPYWSGGDCKINVSGYIWEDTRSLTVSWSGGYDNENNIHGYYYQRSVNGSIDDSALLGNQNSWTDNNIAGLRAGSTIQYLIAIKDTYDSWAVSRYTNTVTKNIFNPGAISRRDEYRDTGTRELLVNLSRATNSNGVTSGIAYTLTASNNLTVHYGNNIDNEGKIKVCKTDSDKNSNMPCIMWNDIKNVLAPYDYNGTITFTMTTNNGHGSSGSSSAGIYFDLRNRSSDFAISSVSGTYRINNLEYFIPGRKPITISWATSSNAVGSAITYRVQEEISGGNWNTITTTTNTSATFNLNSVSSSGSRRFQICAVSSFGYETYSNKYEIPLQFYNIPSVTFESVIRRETSVEITFRTNTHTSIPNVNPKGTYKSTSNTATSYSGATTRVVINNLSGNSTFDFRVYPTDNANDVIGIPIPEFKISVGVYTPIFSLRSKGVGINAFADSTYKLVVGGNSKITGNLLVSNQVESGKLIATNDVVVNGHRVYHGGNKPSTVDVGAIKAMHENSYWGISEPGGDKAAWVRTPIPGIIPYNSGGYSSLGTTGWPFSNAHIQRINDKRVGAISGQYYNAIPVIGHDGVMEIGRYIDFHTPSSDTNDYCGRISINGNGAPFNFTNTIDTPQLNTNKVSINGPSGDFGYIERHDHNGQCWMDIVAGDDENDLVRLCNYHWNDGLRSVLEVDRNNAYMWGDFISNGRLMPTGDAQYGRDIGGGDKRWNTVYCTNVSHGSDRKYKKNIKYLNDEKNSRSANDKTDFRDFIINDFKPAKYELISDEDKVNNKQIGFIAQDIIDTKVGKEFVYPAVGEGGMSFSPAGYTTVVAKALQEEIIFRNKEILSLKEEINNIKKEISDNNLNNKK